jgi:hypothetical protein
MQTYVIEIGDCCFVAVETSEIVNELHGGHESYLLKIKREVAFEIFS